MTSAVLYYSTLQAQNYADKEYYLVDSLDLTSLTETDQQLVDSSLKKYHSSREDTSKINALGDICENLMHESWYRYQYFQYQLIQKKLSSSSDTSRELNIALASALNNIGLINDEQGYISLALDYYHDAIEIFKKLGEKKGMSSCYNNIGFIYNNKGNTSKALEYHHKALEIREKIGDPKKLAYTYNNLGVIHANMGDVPKAMEYYMKALKIREQIGDQKGMSESYNNMGSINSTLGNDIIALEYHNKALNIREEIKDKQGLIYTCNNLGLIYKTQGNIPVALDYYKKALSISEEIGNKEGLAYSYNKIAFIHQYNSDLILAIDYFHKALKLREEIGDKPEIANSYRSIGFLHLEMGNLTKAESFGEKGLSIALEIGFPDAIRMNALLLSKTAKIQAKQNISSKHRQLLYKKALEMYEVHIQMRDSINNEETQKATIRQQTKYEFEKVQLIKEQELKEESRKLKEETSRRDNLQYSVVLICLLVLGGLVAMLGRLSLPERIAEGLIFFAFLILFEFILVVGDPYVESWTGGAPGLKLLINAGVAALIFPLHAFFESKLKGQLVKSRV